MESWRRVWRDGFAPELTDAELLAARDALRDDDPRLIQGATTTPPPLICVQDWPVEAACFLGLCGVASNGGFCPVADRADPAKVAAHARVGDVEGRIAGLCFAADRRLGGSTACRWFLNWFDDTPRDEMRRELLAEVELVVRGRGLDAKPEMVVS